MIRIPSSSYLCARTGIPLCVNIKVEMSVYLLQLMTSTCSIHFLLHAKWLFMFTTTCNRNNIDTVNFLNGTNDTQIYPIQPWGRAVFVWFKYERKSNITLKFNVNDIYVMVLPGNITTWQQIDTACFEESFISDEVTKALATSI